MTLGFDTGVYAGFDKAKIASVLPLATRDSTGGNDGLEALNRVCIYALV